MTSVTRFGWIGYIHKSNRLIRLLQFIFGSLFLHSRQVAYHLFKMVDFTASDKVLDLGSGDGIFSNWVSYKTGCCAVGVDRLSSRIKNSRAISRAYRLNTTFILDDLQTISFKQSTFSKILILDALEHVEYPIEILLMCKKYLMPGGMIAISVPDKDQVRILDGPLEDFFSYGPDKHLHPGFDRDDLVRMLTEAGFINVEVKNFHYMIYQIIWEILEKIRARYQNLYRALVPFFLPFIVLDRLTKLGKPNGLIITAVRL